MTKEIKSAIQKWIEDNRMGPPIHGDVYSSNEPLTDVGIDGQIDLSELADIIESAERERCAKIVDSCEFTAPAIYSDAESVQSYFRLIRARMVAEIRKDRQ